MTWIILQFVFLAMPVVLPALLYRSRRYFMAKFYDKMIWSEKARRLYTHVLLIVLLLFHYVYTSGHPGEFGVVPSTIVCAAWVPEKVRRSILLAEFDSLFLLSLCTGRHILAS